MCKKTVLWDENPENSFICRSKRVLDPKLYEKFFYTSKLIEKGFNDEELKKDINAFDSQEINTNFHDSVIKQYEKLEKFKNSINNEKFEELKSISACKKLNATGTKNSLTLMVEFNDRKARNDVNKFKELLFSKNNPSSLRNYFLEASWNQLDIKGDVKDWMTMSNDYHSYVDAENQNKNSKDWKMPKAQKLVNEALNIAVEKYGSHLRDFAPQGKIEMLIIIFAGLGSDRTGNFASDIYPHYSKLSEPIELDNGITVEDYILFHELPIDDLGGFCHEVAHCLGLPDLYYDTSMVVGQWCLMGAGSFSNKGRTPAHIGAWGKIRLGWVDPIKITDEPKKVEIPEVISSDKIIFKIEVPETNGEEYFLVENRQKIGFDKFLPADGLLIWHINENRCINNFPNFDPENYYVTIVEADGKKELELQIATLDEARKLHITKIDLMGDDGDVFPGGNEIRSFDLNSMITNKENNEIGIYIGSISDSAYMMTAEIGYIDHITKKPTFNEENDDFNEGYRDGYANGFHIGINNSPYKK